jgi:hypothetical protein
MAGDCLGGVRPFRRVEVSPATIRINHAKRPPAASTASFTMLRIALYVRNDNRRPRLVKLIAACGALDVDDPQPAITVMMPDEN